MSEDERQGLLSDLTAEERRAVARRGEFAAHKQRDLGAIPRHLPRDGVACHDDPSWKGRTMTAVREPNAPAGARPREVHIVAHSMLFYWWPVWAVGLLLAGLTFKQAVSDYLAGNTGNRIGHQRPGMDHRPRF